MTRVWTKKTVTVAVILALLSFGNDAGGLPVLIGSTLASFGVVGGVHWLYIKATERGWTASAVETDTA